MNQLLAGPIEFSPEEVAVILAVLAAMAIATTIPAGAGAAFLYARRGRSAWAGWFVGTLVYVAVAVPIVFALPSFYGAAMPLGWIAAWAWAARGRT
ncbi:MAG: hypothetical protein SGJ13_00445 [Actinomycetota bacterium]|nr:hypothetical protein [Actinomycetota bacterium]